MDKRRYPRYAVEYPGSFLGNGISLEGMILNPTNTLNEL
jgi:hypothetical protein